MAASEISLKLLIDKKSQRLLFAEAGNEFVDFLCDIFTLPLGTVTRLLKEESMVGCLQNLYKGIDNLSDTYIQPGQTKDLVLKPKEVSAVKAPLLFPKLESWTSRNFYKCDYHSCSHRGVYLAYTQNTQCRTCYSLMAREVTFEDLISATKASGLVKETITYMVMDDLEIKPMSATSFITLLSEYDVKDVGAIEEKVVDFGMDEALKLLEASLQSKTVLTDVFLPKPSETWEKNGQVVDFASPE